MATKSMRIARHVYLRTQQRRLRHVKGVMIRNLTLSNIYLEDPLQIAVFFTVHVPQRPDKVLFKSDPVHGSYNPSWESIQLVTHEFGHYGTLPSFILRVWVKCGQKEGEKEEEECAIVFERKLELFDLAYLGLMVTKDGSSYPPNSVVVGMYEGLYSCPEVGGVPCAPRIVHTLTDFLPPQSLLEVPKKDVVDSYLQPVLTRILSCQEELNSARREARTERAEVEQYVQLEKMFFEKRSEKERLITRLKLLRAQLQELESPQKEESDHLERVSKQADETERDLVARQTDLRQKLENLSTATRKFARKKDQMLRCKKNRQFRQRHMVHELSNTFVIREYDETFTICNVILPNADQLEQPSRVEQLGVALGYVAHLVHHLGKILFIPLLYPIRPQGSKSVICDSVSEETLIDNIKEFPLFAKGSEKALFQYAVFLLNKDIAQVRQHCGYGTSKSMFKRTLPNLKFLLDRLTRDIKAMVRGVGGFPTVRPSDAASMTSSYVSADRVSIASGSAGSLQSPGAECSRSYPNFFPQTSPASASSLKQTQQFIRNDNSFSPKSSSDLAENVNPDYHDSSLEPCGQLSPDKVDAVGDDAETPLATKPTLTQSFSLTRGTESRHPRTYFSTIHEDTPPSGDEGSMLQNSLSESADDSITISSRLSLSTTPLVTDELVTSDESDLTSNLSLTRSNGEESGEILPRKSVTEVSSSATQVGNLEDTLKSAVHVTQVLLGHTPQEHIEIEPAPTICSINDAEIESTQAVLNLATASFVGDRVVVKPQDPVKDTQENGQQFPVEQQVPQGPPLIPDSFELLPMTTRQLHRENHTEEYNSDRPHTRAHALAYSAFTLDSGYIKTGMSTPHKVGASQTDDRDSRYTSMIHKSSGPRGENDENGRSLADFIDTPSQVRRGPQNRWKFGPNKVSSRGAF